MPGNHPPNLSISFHPRQHIYFVSRRFLFINYPPFKKCICKTSLVMSLYYYRFKIVSNWLMNKLAKICSWVLIFIFLHDILVLVGNENKQMWFATFNPQLMLWVRRWCYDRSSFIRNTISTFIWLNCRNYYSVCLNYTGYNFKQIK